MARRRSKIKIFIGIITAILLGAYASLLTEDKITTEPNIPQSPGQEVVAPKSKEYVDMIFAGDIMMHRGVESSVNKNFAGDYNALFKNIEFLKTFDIIFANLEGPASDKGTKKGSIYSFKMNPVIIDALKNAGINILSFSNNHVGDYGHEAFIDTMDRLEHAGIPFAGAGMNASEAEQVTILEKNGMRIGFLAFSDVGPAWMEATETRAGSLLSTNKRYEEIIRTAAAQVDYLVVSIHFGDEYKPIHNDRQEILAHKAVDNGAKIVIGHHPHVNQDTEVYKNSYIAYSLGNFIFDQSWSEPTMIGMLLQIRLHKDGSMDIKKNITQLNRYFQIESVTEGIEENFVF